MSIQESPLDLKSWVEYLKDKALPIRSSVHQRLKRAVKDDRTTLNTLSALIKSDPVVCLHVVRLANQLHTQKGSHVTGLEHAVHSLGFDQIEKLVDRLPTMRLNAAAVSHKMFFRSIAHSHFASVAARHWQSAKNPLFTEESQLAALFYAVSHWMMWLYAPLHMSAIQHKIRHDGVDVVLAETDVLGCTLQELSHDLAMEWNLPLLVIESLDHDTSPSRNIIDLMHRHALRDPSIEDEEMRTLNHMVQQKCYAVKLANWVAITSSFGWYQKKTKKLSMIIGDFLGRDSAEVMTELHRYCADSAHHFAVAGTLSPAAEMLFIPSDLQPNYKVEQREVDILQPDCPRPGKPAAKTDAAAAETESATLQAETTQRKAVAPTPPPPTAMPAYRNELLFKKMVQLLAKGSDKLSKPGQVLQLTAKALHEGLGMERVVLYQVLDHHMQASLTLGVADDHTLSQYRFNLDIPSIFKRLCDKPGVATLTADTRDEMLNQLPEHYHTHIPRGGAVILSLFNGLNPLAIIHTDIPDKSLGEFQIKGARLVCTAATQALKRLAQPG